MNNIIKNYNNHGIKPNLTFYRDSNQNEVDLIIELGTDNNVFLANQTLLHILDIL